MQLAARALAFSLLLVAPVLALSPPAQASGFVTFTNVVASFDGTPIVTTLFQPLVASETNSVPVVLRGHGWGGQRETTPSSTTQALLDAGYAVLTWDARGFGQSGGKTELDAPEYEVRDVRAVLDWYQPRAHLAGYHLETDANGQLVAAMSGVSYAGGIQLLTSAVEPRVKAIAPEITWNDLRYSLGPHGVVKNQWIQLLFWDGLASSTANGMGVRRDATSTAAPSQDDVGFGPAGPQTGGYDTNLPTYFAETMATNGPTPDVLDALYHRSAAAYASQLTAPTLLIQGWPDSLFVPNEAVANYQATLANGAPAKLILYCGGHAGCPYDDAGECAHLDASIVAWFDKYVKNQTVDTGAPVEWYNSQNVLQTALAWPIPGTQTVHASGFGDVVAAPVPTAGGVVVKSGSGMPNQLPPAGYQLPVAVPAGAEITGLPHLRVDLDAGSAAITGDATLFARLVDTTSGKIIDDQVTPLRFQGNEVVDVDMTGVSYKVPAGDQIALEISGSDAAFLSSRFPGILEFRADVDVPVLTP